MARAADTYSRVIAWLKVLLPLVALALLSTVFLLSTDPEQALDLPVAQSDLRDRASKLQVTNPYFTGTTESGAQVSLFAEAARPSPKPADDVQADSVEARIVMQDGTRVQITAPGVTLDPGPGALTLSGGIVLASSSGYIVHTNTLTGSFDPIHAETVDTVEGEGPPGRFTAGRMTLTEDAATGNLYLNFTEGVKLIYLPEKQSE